MFQRRSVLRALQGALLALVLWATGAVCALFELSAGSSLPVSSILTLIVSVSAVATFGAVLGRREDRWSKEREALDRRAFTDTVTGLRNARYFRIRMQEALEASKRACTPVSVVVFDLDHFKRVNDEHGHPKGDSVLFAAAQAIASVVRRAETAARIGGEEFALILPGAEAATAERVAERVREAIQVRTRRLGVPVTASAGVATSLGRGVGPRGLVDLADRALLVAKREGRDRVVVAGAEVAEDPQKRFPPRAAGARASACSVST